MYKRTTENINTQQQATEVFKISQQKFHWYLRIFPIIYDLHKKLDKSNKILITNYYFAEYFFFSFFLLGNPPTVLH